MPDTSKSRLGKYELLEIIGDGAEGRIYKARCVETGVSGVAVGELVALKRLRQTGSETQSDIFRRTTRILHALDHPNIVRYKDSFDWRGDDLDEEVYCLVTELLEGETIKDVIDKNTSGLHWNRAQEIIVPTLLALEYAGNHSVVHRDLKPSNIYLTRQGDVKLIDFGIARHEDSGATTTSSGGLLGSWDYMAPDFVRMSHESNFRGDQQSDIFSFGVCFYQLVTGRLPFPSLGSNPQMAYLQRWMAPEAPKVKFSHDNFSLLLGLRACVQKCLAVERENRYKTFTEVLVAVRLIQRRKLQHDEELYEYLGYIGKGGFGRVYHGRRMSDGLEVAIKEVLADRNASRFVREANTLKTTRHPHLVRYLDFVESSEKFLGEERRLFLVLEFLAGMPQAGLSHRIKMAPSGLDPVELLPIFSAYLDCLGYLHRRGIIHRDIKPGNLYAPENAPESAKIFDLGIAHDTEGTKTHGQVPGTLDYMPFEFARQGAERGTPQSDIYSLGVTLYQALTGKLPFERLPPEEKNAWVAWYGRCENPPAVPFDHDVFHSHPELEPLLRKALAVRWEDRFPDAEAMREEIRTMLETWDRENRKSTHDQSLAAAQAALAKQEYDDAARHVQNALAAWPEGAEARQLLGRIESERQRKIRYDTALAAAKEALKRDNLDAAARGVRSALETWPDGLEAKRLAEEIETERRRRIKYDTAIMAAKAALKRNDLDVAAQNIRIAMEVFPEGGEAVHLLDQVQTQKRYRNQYNLAITAARKALEQRAYEEAITHADEALSLNPLDSIAQDLRSRAQNGIRARDEPEPKTVAPADEDSVDGEAATAVTTVEPPPQRPTPADIEPAPAGTLEPLSIQPEVTMPPEPTLEPSRPPTAAPPPPEVTPPPQAELPKRQKKSMVPILLPIAACVVLAISVVVWQKLQHNPILPKAPEPITNSTLASNTSELTNGVGTTPTKETNQTNPLPPETLPALVLYSESAITHDIADTNLIRIPCLARNPDRLDFVSSSLEFLPNTNISFSSNPVAGQTNTGDTNGWITLQPRPGHTNDVDVVITGTGDSLLPTTNTVHLKVVGQPTPPRIDSTPGELVLKPGEETNVAVKVSSDYFESGELSLTNKTNDPPNIVETDIQRAGDGFALRVHALQQPRPGQVTIELLLEAPNGTFAPKVVLASILPVPTPAPYIYGPPTNVITSTGATSQPIQFTVTGASPPLTFDGGFGPGRIRKYDLRWESNAAGTNLTITLTVKPPQDLSDTDTLTTIVGDASAQQATNQFIFQFAPRENKWAGDSIKMPFVWVAKLPECQNSQWTDRANGGWVGQYEVTQDEFKQVLGLIPAGCMVNGNGRLPVQNMKFEDAAQFCDELTKLDAATLPVGWRYALPTEAQWEFFAAGTEVNTNNACYLLTKPKPTAPQEVGRLDANPLGLYDVLGNVAELTRTHWHYSADKTEMKYYICRGGGFNSASPTLVINEQDTGDYLPWMFSGPKADCGFRVILIPKQTSQ